MQACAARGRACVCLPCVYVCVCVHALVRVRVAHVGVRVPCLSNEPSSHALSPLANPRLDFMLPQLHGYEPLRSKLQDLTTQLQRPLSNVQVTVTCGSTYGLDVALDLLLERGDPLLLEEYTYSHALEAQLAPKG